MRKFLGLRNIVLGIIMKRNQENFVRNYLFHNLEKITEGNGRN